MNALLLVANYDSSVGYAWWLMESLWVRLAERFHGRLNVLLAYPSISTIPKAIVDAPIRIVRQDFSSSDIAQVISQCKFLKRHRVRSVYFSDRPTLHWRYLLYRLFGVRSIIIHDHTPGVRTPALGIKGLLKRSLHRLPWLSVDSAIGATEFVRRRLIQVNGLPPSRCRSAPNGLPPLSATVVPADLHGLFHIPEEKVLLVMTSRASRYKGVEFVLECLVRLRSSGDESLHFVFIGDGPDLDAFKDTARTKGVSDRCTFTGRRSDVSSLIEAAHIAIHPSRGEVGYSLSILEYMRAGLPLVVPNNPSVCGATEHNVTGLIYPEGDVSAATQILLTLLRDEALRIRLGSKARIAVRHYSLAKTHQALLSAFKETYQSWNSRDWRGK